MQRNLPSDAAALSASLAAADELMLWNAEVSSLTVQNGGDILRRLMNRTPDGCTSWTNEKHNLYLNNLEVSFVTQLHESRDLVNKNMTPKQPINSPEQDFQKLSDNEKNSSEKGILSHGSATCSQQAFALNLYQANSFDSMKEGTGQNYVNEDNDKPNLRSGVEKKKSAKADG